MRKIRLVVDESITTTYEVEVPDDLDINDDYEIGEWWDGLLLTDSEPKSTDYSVTERWFDAKEMQS